MVELESIAVKKINLLKKNLLNSKIEEDEKWIENHADRREGQRVHGTRGQFPQTKDEQADPRGERRELRPIHLVK